MTTIFGIWPNLGRPAARLDSLVPLWTSQDIGILKLVNDGVCRFVFSAHCPSLTTDIHDQLFPLVARNPKHTRNSTQVWNMFLIIDLVEERLVLRIHVHTDDHQILGFSWHFIAPKEISLFRAPIKEQEVSRTESLRYTTISRL